MTTSAQILVVGGGISGLACAWRLRQLGLSVWLIERGTRFGGVIETLDEGGFRFDIGPQSFTNTAPLAELIEELGLTGELLQAPPRAPRYVLKHGRLVPAPLSPPRLLFTPLLSGRTKLRILGEPLRRTEPPNSDESIADFVRRKFGADLLENFAGPFVSGVWAGDPEKLSLAGSFPSLHALEKRYGSVIRGAIKQRRESRGKRPSLCNFPQGISSLVSTLVHKLGGSATSGTEVGTIRRAPPTATARFEVAYNLAGATQTAAVSAIVFAAPADATGRLLREIDAGFAPLLEKIEYAGVAQVSAGYGLEQINYWNTEKGLAGFGFLVPRTEGLRLLGTVWNSSLFAARAPTGMASFTSFLGGMTDPEIVSKSPEEIAAIAHGELASVLSITGAPAAQHVSRWERALPQCNIGHQRIVSDLQALCARSPGIFLAGNYLGGPSMGACVERANEVARAVARFCSGRT